MDLISARNALVNEIFWIFLGGDGSDRVISVASVISSSGSNPFVAISDLQKSSSGVQQWRRRMSLLRRHLQPVVGPRGDHARRRVPTWLNRSCEFNPSALDVSRERLLPFHRRLFRGDKPAGVAGEIDIPRIKIQYLRFCP